MENLITGIEGAEGPCVSREGRIFMVGSNGSRVLEVSTDGHSRDIARTGGLPGGLQIDRNNDLWVADMERGVFRITPDGTIYPEVTHYDGAPIRGCNDCYFDSMGNFYFTAPAGSDAENPCGELFCRLATGEVRRLDGGFAFCNGLAVSADDRTLIVAETYTRHLYAYDIEEPGQVTHKRIWSTLPETGLGPDGMDFDAEGNLLVANFGGSAIEVFDLDGRWQQSMALPFEQVTNIHFGGPDSSMLLITEMSNGGLWQMEYARPGQMQFGWT